MLPPRPPALPFILAAQNAYHADLVEEVAREVASNDLVVVGVLWLQPARKARALLTAEKIPFKYLQYGSYFAGWRRRLALKIWAGWPTFPLIFVKGTFIGGYSNLKKLHQAGELRKLLAGQPAEALKAAS